MNNGWVKLHRKLLNSSIWDNPDILKMAIWCLLKASHTEHKVMVGTTEVTLQAGQFVTGRAVGSAELKLKPATWYKHLKCLEAVGFCNIKSNNKFSLVTVENWGLYQLSTDEEEQQKEQQSSNKVATKEQQSSTYKKEKKEKNEKNVSYRDEHQDLSTGKTYSKKHQEEMDKLTGYKPINNEVAKKLDALRKRIEENANN